MAANDSGSLEVQEKKELKSEEEPTTPGRYYLPNTDIYERDDALIVVMEMPGVSRDGITVRVENNLLDVEGQIDFAKYADMRPVYTEYNIGHFSRRFHLSSKIDQEKITANTENGILRIELPKAEEARPRQIPIR